ncbi:hypothetical protein VKT23_017559 [Stygiomarasmius scandens]|uniref:HNH nuclease domain-containing protein n=1 Tax=Marasmiellus scandens TaxID=2682957 RepID=A0ABR1IRL3_9AGAR
MYNPPHYGTTPLLPPSSADIQNLFGPQSDVLHAYSLCYQEQERLTEVGAETEPLIHIRVLGWIFVFSPTSPMLDDLTVAVVSCNGISHKYNGLGKFCVDFWIRTFRKYKGQTPKPTGHVSRPSFDKVVDMIAVELQPYPDDHSSAKKNALIRDGFRCVLSGVYDMKSYQTINEVKAEVDGGSGFTGTTQCAHIFSSSTNSDISGNDKERFSHRSVFEELTGTGIHRLENVFTLHTDYHDLFDTLQLWFEPTPEDNHYKVGTSQPVIFRRVPREVTFKNNHFVNEDDTPVLPMPSKEYLSLHAACAKVANMSGAAEYLEDLDREREEGKTLAADGSSMPLFANVLWDAVK